jgi:hypothetical protein
MLTSHQRLGQWRIPGPNLAGSAWAVSPDEFLAHSCATGLGPTIGHEVVSGPLLPIQPQLGQLLPDLGDVPDHRPAD